MSKILLTGGTGLIGNILQDLLRLEGHNILTLSRHSSPSTIKWSPTKKLFPHLEVGEVDIVIHLAGENIASGRWSEKAKKQFWNSRIDSTKLIVDGMKQMKTPPKLFICASAIGYYNDGFLGDLCRAWEEEANKAPVERIVNTRFGIVLSPDGGALKKMLLPFYLGLGGPLGDGKQYMSWVSLKDTARSIIHCINTPNLTGPVDVVSPTPVMNEEFTKTLASTLHRPAFLRVPAFVLRLFLGEMADELLLISQKVTPDKLLETNFHFEHLELKDFFEASLSQRP